MTKFVEVQGGAPGLVQQRVKKYPPQKKKNDFIYPWIKDDIKSRAKIDLVFMQAGISYCTVEEDAELMHKKFGHKYRNPHGNHPYYETSCGSSYIDALIKKIERFGLSYALLKITNSGKPSIRTVTQSSCKELIGLKY